MWRNNGGLFPNFFQYNSQKWKEMMGPDDPTVRGRRISTVSMSHGKGYALSVSDDGPGLPEGFNPTKTNGLGMKLISSLVRQIGGQLQIARGDNGKGTQFTVLFS
jgi:two-component sensor histidine kinase